MSAPAQTHEHDQGHDHEQGHHHHGHDHPHGHVPGHHDHGTGPLGWLATVFHWHGHDQDATDAAADPARATNEGIRTVWLALGALSLSTLLQILIVVLSGSVALLADTVHNLGDALNSIPLLIAFYLARRPPTRRYTYGYGRAEDVAGVVIVLSILFSAGYIFWESFRKLLNPEPIEHLPWVVAAAIVGFVGNEAVALIQIRTGHRIGSASLVADGLHARIDGLTSLVVLVAVAGSAVGIPIMDPIVGLLIGVTILFIARDATKRVWHRLMDAVDPAIVDHIERHAAEIPGVERVESARARWVGHELQAELTVALGGTPTLRESHQVVDAVRDALIGHIRHLGVVTIETVPTGKVIPGAESPRSAPPTTH